MGSKNIRRTVRFTPDTEAEIAARAEEDKVSFDEEVRRIVKKQLAVEASADNIIIGKLNSLKKSASDILTQLTLQWYVLTMGLQEFLVRNPLGENGPSDAQRNAANAEFKEMLGNLFKDMRTRQKSFFDEVVAMVTEIPPTEETE